MGAGKGIIRRIRAAKMTTLPLQQLNEILTNSLGDKQKALFKLGINDSEEYKAKGFDGVCSVDSAAFLELLSEDDGVAAWNEAVSVFEATHPNTQLILSDMKLEDLGLRGIKIKMCDLDGIVFKQCDLRDVEIPYAKNTVFDRCAVDEGVLDNAFGAQSYYRLRPRENFEKIKEGFTGSFLGLLFSVDKDGTIMA